MKNVKKLTKSAKLVIKAEQFNADKFDDIQHAAEDVRQEQIDNGLSDLIYELKREGMKLKTRRVLSKALSAIQSNLITIEDLAADEAERLNDRQMRRDGMTSKVYRYRT